VTAVEGERDAALEQVTAITGERDAARAELATTSSALEQSAKQVAALTAKLAVPADNAERAMTQSDPNANLSPAPTPASQSYNTPIAVTRGRNFSLAPQWRAAPFGSGSYHHW
jgi:soluble lytic murein transglycosylase-like protein